MSEPFEQLKTAVVDFMCASSEPIDRYEAAFENLKRTMIFICGPEKLREMVRARNEALENELT
jgi:hypothetical protein